jgi:hypothetical protein
LYNKNSLVYNKIQPGVQQKSAWCTTKIAWCTTKIAWCTTKISLVYNKNSLVYNKNKLHIGLIKKPQEKIEYTKGVDTSHKSKKGQNTMAKTVHYIDMPLGRRSGF